MGFKFITRNLTQWIRVEKTNPQLAHLYKVFLFLGWIGLSQSDFSGLGVY